MNIQYLVFSLNIQISENSYCAELITNIFLTWNCFHYLININKWKLQSSEFKDLRSCVTMSHSVSSSLLLYTQMAINVSLFLYYLKVTHVIDAFGEKN